MKEKLTISLVQINLIWENPNSNRNVIEKYIIDHPAKVDLFILPEMFTSGFTMSPKRVSESMQGVTVNWLKELSKKKNSAICGSLVIKDNDCFYNRFLFVDPDGFIQYYDKRHTFNMVGEGDSYCRGANNGLIKFREWKILLRVCYDLRFPVWSRNTHNYDLLIFVANWPSPRINAWNNLLTARAIENISYCVGVNRIGSDENQNHYPGNSIVIDPMGNRLLDLEEKAGICSIELDKSKLMQTRSLLPFLEDRDSFILE